jgi:hypothetical protein
MLLVPVDDLPAALTDLHIHGLRVAGADANAPMTARESDLRGPLALVVGSEGQGLGPQVHRRCDLLVRIPMRGAIGSLNAAVAGSILLFEALAQREPAVPSKPGGSEPRRGSGERVAPRAEPAGPAEPAPESPAPRESLAAAAAEPQAPILEQPQPEPSTASVPLTRVGQTGPAARGSATRGSATRGSATADAPSTRPSAKPSKRTSKPSGQTPATEKSKPARKAPTKGAGVKGKVAGKPAPTGNEDELLRE